jgi:endonuclease/exonuclease/phosphatase family metal-dependent hydrolase
MLLVNKSLRGTSNRGHLILICSVYRSQIEPPEFWDHFSDSIQHALTLNNPIIIVGDLNDDLLKHGPSPLKDIINNFGLYSVIDKPTRSKTLLDPIIVNNIDLVNFVEVIPIARTFSDHEAVCVFLKNHTVPNGSFTRQVW